MLGVIGQQCCVRLHAALSPVQTDATLLDVTCCVRFHTLLHVVPQMFLRVVAQSLKPVKLFSQQLPTFLLFCDRRSVAQQCWIRLHSSSNIVGATHAHYAWITKTYGLIPRCTAGPNIVGSCCIRLHTTANTHATTPNIVGATMLWVVRPFCRSLRDSWYDQLQTELDQNYWGAE